MAQQEHAAPPSAPAPSAAGRVLQRAAVRADLEASGVPPIVHEVLRSPGRPLDDATRAYMEPRFGHDFSAVRVHDDDRAAASAQAVNADAYTVGSDIVLRRNDSGQASPGGRAALAHELAHVVQQHSGAPTRPGERVSDPGDGLEREALATAQRVLASPATAGEAGATALGPPSPGPSSTVLQRQVSSPATLEDTLRFVVNEAGFAQGRATPPNVGTHSKADASRFGTAAHNLQLRDAVDRARRLGWPGADRLVEGVRVNGRTGEVIGINVRPGGKGTLNFDLVVLKAGAQLRVGDLIQDQVSMTGDVKFGDLSTNRAQAGFARRHGFAHVNLRAGNFKLQQAGAQGTSRKATTPSTPPGGGTAPPKAPATAPGTTPKAPVKAPRGGGVQGITGGRTARVPSSRGGGGLGAAAAGAVAAGALDMAARHYLQREMDKKNEEEFKRKLAAQQKDIEALVAGQDAVAQQLEAQGRPVFVNVTVYVRYQTDVSGQLHGVTALMDVKVRKVEVSATKLEHVREGKPDEGLATHMFKGTFGISEALLFFSLSYPDLEPVSLPDPDALPPPNCFIATACYGSPLAPEVTLLRQFRDEWLRDFPAGRAFIRAYYVLSPPIAEHLSRHAAARAVVRNAVIAPVVELVRAEQPRWRPTGPGPAGPSGSEGLP